jgi:hypothetical protein
VQQLSSQLAKMTDFKKKLIIKELINGNMSRQSHKLLKVMLKGASLDFNTQKQKKLIITSTLKAMYPNSKND